MVCNLFMISPSCDWKVHLHWDLHLGTGVW